MKSALLLLAASATVVAQQSYGSYGAPRVGFGGVPRGAVRQVRRVPVAAPAAAAPVNYQQSGLDKLATVEQLKLMQDSKLLKGKQAKDLKQYNAINGRQDLAQSFEQKLQSFLRSDNYNRDVAKTLLNSRDAQRAAAKSAIFAKVEGGDKETEDSNSARAWTTFRAKNYQNAQNAHQKVREAYKTGEASLTLLQRAQRNAVGKKQALDAASSRFNSFKQFTTKKDVFGVVNTDDRRKATRKNLARTMNIQSGQNALANAQLATIQAELDYIRNPSAETEAALTKAEMTSEIASTGVGQDMFKLISNEAKSSRDKKNMKRIGSILGAQNARSKTDLAAYGR